jgi:CRISPR-associated endonuclease Csn1
LPNRAATANTPRENWTLIDESFEFRFSLAANDHIALKTKKAEFVGYFAGMDIATAAITILSHDRNGSVGKDGAWRSLGIKVGVEHFEKFNVDVLGNVHRIEREIHRDLA